MQKELNIFSYEEILERIHKEKIKAPATIKGLQEEIKGLKNEVQKNKAHLLCLEIDISFIKKN